MLPGGRSEGVFRPYVEVVTGVLLNSPRSPNISLNFYRASWRPGGFDGRVDLCTDG